MTPDDITKLFTRSDDQYVFARWGRPIVPIVFGVEDETLPIIKGAVEAVVTLANHKMAEHDGELGANMMWFFLRDWDELLDTPNLERLIPELAPLVARLQQADANQYRIFRFDPDGGIKACFVFLRMDGHLADMPADTLALAQAVQSIVLWSDEAFLGNSPLAILSEGSAPILKPDIANVIRASYDPMLPNAASDSSHALRLFARLAV